MVRHIRLFSLAAETFASAGEAKQWFFEANYALGGRVPVEMAETDPGARMVEGLLLGIQHGHPLTHARALLGADGRWLTCLLCE